MEQQNKPLLFCLDIKNNVNLTNVSVLTGPALTLWVQSVLILEGHEQSLTSAAEPTISQTDT